MRRRYRRRSWLGLTFWFLALAGPTAGIAWKFDWLPLETRQTDWESATDRSAADAQSVDPQAALRFGKSTPVSSTVFTEQTEPPDRPELDELPAADGLVMEPFRSPRAISNPRRLRHYPNQTAVASSVRELQQPEPMQDRHVPQSVLDESQSLRQIEQVSNEIELPADNSRLAEPDLDAIDAQIAAGDLLDAHRQLSEIYWNQPESRDKIRSRIENTAHSIFFSPFPHYLEPYVVQSGDQLRLVARKYNVPWQYLSKLNRIEPQRVRAGQRLKVIQGPFSALIDLSDYEMTIHARGYFVCAYPVGIGKDHSTPTETFTVLNKVANPQYTAPDGTVVDADDPENPLGERWIDLGNSYGIHGTIEPDSIGRAESRGCIRLRSEDIEDAFDLISIGSEVTIRP